MSQGIQMNIELVGNLIILLAERCKPLHHTKMMKLLFLIDEESTRVKGAPITWLDYKAWKFGPVSPELFYSKNKGYNKLSRFVSFENAGGNNSCSVKPVKPFDNSEFSEWDLEIIESVIAKYGKLNTSKLIDITHENNSLWKKTVREHGIRFSEENMTSDKSLDFLKLIDTDRYKKSVYYSTLENIEIQSTLG